MNVTSRSDVELMMVLPREDASGVPVGKVPMPKAGQKPSSPRRDVSEALVGKVAVPMDLPHTLSGPRRPKTARFYGRAPAPDLDRQINAQT